MPVENRQEINRNCINTLPNSHKPDTQQSNTLNNINMVNQDTVSLNNQSNAHQKDASRKINQNTPKNVSPKKTQGKHLNSNGNEFIGPPLNRDKEPLPLLRYVAGKKIEKMKSLSKEDFDLFYTITFLDEDKRTDSDSPTHLS